MINNDYLNEHNHDSMRTSILRELGNNLEKRIKVVKRETALLVCTFKTLGNLMSINLIIPKSNSGQVSRHQQSLSLLLRLSHPYLSSRCHPFQDLMSKELNYLAITALSGWNLCSFLLTTGLA